MCSPSLQVGGQGPVASPRRANFANKVMLGVGHLLLCRAPAALLAAVNDSAACLALPGSMKRLRPVPRRCHPAGTESACREHLNQLNAAVHGLHGLATGVQV